MIYTIKNTFTQKKLVYIFLQWGAIKITLFRQGVQKIDKWIKKRKTNKKNVKKGCLLIRSQILF